MKIDNVKVYDLEESIVASGLPMQAEYDENSFYANINELGWNIEDKERFKYHHFKRAVKLASNPASSGHCNFLTGIRVSFNVTATNAWLLQSERYHFLDIVSCQSKMHRLKNMLNQENVAIHEKVNPRGVIAYAIQSNKDDIESMIYNCPMGLELTCRMSTNYLQLKTIYNQRCNHRLKEWRDFCEWIKTLPFANELIIANNTSEQNNK